MARRGRICATCGKKYEYCGTCSSFANLPTWHYCYCSKTCKDIYNTIEEYIVIDEEERTEKDAVDAYNILKKYDFSKVEEFRPGIRINYNLIKSIAENATTNYVDNDVANNAVDNVDTVVSAVDNNVIDATTIAYNSINTVTEEKPTAQYEYRRNKHMKNKYNN